MSALGRYYFPGLAQIDAYREAFALDHGRRPTRAQTMAAHVLAGCVVRPQVHIGRINFHPILKDRLAPREVRFPSTDGLTLAGLLMRHPEARSTVVLLHGRGVNKESTLHYAPFLLERHNVFAFDFRHHGESEGEISTFGEQETRDLSGALDWLAAEGLGPFAAMGVSLGAATAILGAGLDRRVSAVVADCPFANLRDLLFYHRDLRRIPREPYTALTKWILDRLDLGFDIARVNPEDAIGRHATPTFIIHGRSDGIIPPVHAERLAARASGPVELWLCKGGHGTAYFWNRAEYRSRVTAFLARHLVPLTAMEAAAS